MLSTTYNDQRVCMTTMMFDNDFFKNNTWSIIGNQRYIGSFLILEFNNDRLWVQYRVPRADEMQ